LENAFAVGAPMLVSSLIFAIAVSWNSAAVSRSSSLSHVILVFEGLGGAILLLFYLNSNLSTIGSWSLAGPPMIRLASVILPFAQASVGQEMI
jgi:hypothetical protein